MNRPFWGYSPLRNGALLLVGALFWLTGQTRAQDPINSPGQSYCIRDAFGYDWQTAVVKTGVGHFELSGQVHIDGMEWDFQGTYVQDGAQIDLVAVNPLANDCALTSGSMHYIGLRNAGTFSGNWTNDCGGFGAWTARVRPGTCPAPRDPEQDKKNGGSGKGNVANPWQPDGCEPAAGKGNCMSDPELLAWTNTLGHASLFDLQGRMVRVLSTLSLETALAGVQLSVHDATGRGLPQGIYVLRMGSLERLVVVN